MEHITNHKTDEPAWFELYTSYYRCTEVIRLLETHNVEYFFPMHTENIVYKGEVLKKRVPSVPGIIFARTSGEKIKEIIKNSVNTGIRTINNGTGTMPLIIPDYRMKQMTELYIHNNNELSLEEIKRLTE